VADMYSLWTSPLGRSQMLTGGRACRSTEDRFPLVGLLSLTRTVDEGVPRHSTLEVAQPRYGAAARISTVIGRPEGAS
jgi:hypothetical protein